MLREDVWRWCRHPNYLGELGFWLALGIAGYTASGNPMSWAGIVVMVLLFLFISIPMIEKRQTANKSGYAAYQADVSRLLPIGGLLSKSRRSR